MRFSNFTLDQPGMPAVLFNSQAAAEQLGYHDVSGTVLSKIKVFHSGIKVLDEEVGEGKFRSAIWVEALMSYRNLDPHHTKTLDIDDAAVLILSAYMGEQIWLSASEEIHLFVHAIKSGKLLGAKIKLVVETRSKK